MMKKHDLISVVLRCYHVPCIGQVTFKGGAPLKEYLQQRISSFREPCTLVEVLTWLKEIIFSEMSMKEKLKIVKNYVYFVKPISWYSKSFTAQQILKYGTLEKETLALVTSIMNFRDRIEAAPITFIQNKQP